MLPRNHYKTIVISDVHLGSSGSKAKECARFLKSNTCDKLILNGDIIDGWQLSSGGEWKKRHTRCIRAILKMVEKCSTRVIYVRGNHDDFLDNILPLQVGPMSIVREYVHFSQGRRFLVTHGDIFDSITTRMRWLAKLGDVGYTLLLWVNKIYNNYRLERGLPYDSISKKVKGKVKGAVSYISDFENQLVKLAVAKKYNGIICGHIHEPAIKTYGEISYLNSGDWIENMSALVEDFEGNWSVVLYSEELRKEELGLSGNVKEETQKDKKKKGSKAED
jgi:UDP-2,3-diacylglucosamine pyrophosphatase LpxH